MSRPPQQNHRSRHLVLILAIVLGALTLLALASIALPTYHHH